ncbi:MAG: hypothetical protein KAS32_03090 [Candidatus Peribacteraceae bacterium]|nr:hypothetical protein [Candidatus Peribacteraceae bacterium]
MIRATQVSRIVEHLEEVRRVSTMKTADFSGEGIGEGIDARPMDLPKDRKGVTAYIKRVTRLWRYTWITDPLEEVIEQLKHELER